MTSRSSRFSPSDPTPIELAWAAGFLDGEGCFQLVRAFDKQKGYFRYQARIGVTQRRRGPLDKLRGMFGGSIRAQPRKDTGKSYWFWWVSTGQCARCVELVLPYLELKKPEALVVLEFRALMAARYRKRTPAYTHGERELQQALYERCRALKLVSD